MKNSLVRAGFGAACRPVKTLSGRQSLMPVSPRNHEKLFPRLLGGEGDDPSADGEPGEGFQSRAQCQCVWNIAFHLRQEGEPTLGPPPERQDSPIGELHMRRDKLRTSSIPGHLMNR